MNFYKNTRRGNTRTPARPTYPTYPTHGRNMGWTARSRRSSRQHHPRTHQPDGHGIGMIRAIAPLNDTDDHRVLQMPSRSPAMVEGSGSQHMVRHFIDAAIRTKTKSTRMMAGQQSDGMRGADGDHDARGTWMDGLVVAGQTGRTQLPCRFASRIIHERICEV